MPETRGAGSTDRRPPLTDAYESEAVLVTRGDLYRLLGQLALPPFVGHPEADSWDCAPLASTLIPVVERFFADRPQIVTA